MDIQRNKVGVILQTKKIKNKNGRTSRKKIKIPKFNYVDSKTKKIVKDKKILERIKSLHIPPAYTNVYIAKNLFKKVQAIGTDELGRKQYIYSKKHTQSQEKNKFKELVIFGNNYEKIKKEYNKILKSTIKNKNIETNKEGQVALVLYLIDVCNFRVGCDKYKKLYNSFGATTLNKTHIIKIKNMLQIKFIGKKGVVNKANISNKDVCGVISKLCSINNGDYLFQYKSEKGNIRITERDINIYLKKYSPKIKVKMFRTWNANMMLLDNILKYPMPEDVREATNNIKEIVEQAAEKMHHTKTVSKKSYMNNGIIDLYQNNLEQFKQFFKNLKKSYGGKVPRVENVLTKLLEYLNKK